MNKKPLPSTLAVNPELRTQVRDRAERLGMTVLELTNAYIQFALENCEVEKPPLIIRHKQQLLSV